MPHPMHLHGHGFRWWRSTRALSRRGARHLLIPATGGSPSRSTLNNPGRWAFHCHLLYHLDAGMFTTIKYA